MVAPLSDYWRAMSRDPEAENSALGILRWTGRAADGRSAPADMVAAFNAWRAAEYEAAKVYCAARYPADWDRYFPEPESPVCAGHYDATTGHWSRLPALALAA
jgi:hypothetical protein